MHVLLVSIEDMSVRPTPLKEYPLRCKFSSRPSIVAELMDSEAADEESPPLVLHHSEMKFPRDDVQHLRSLKRTYAQAGKSRSFSNTEKN